MEGLRIHSSKSLTELRSISVSKPSCSRVILHRLLAVHSSWKKRQTGHYYSLSHDIRHDGHVIADTDPIRPASDLHFRWGTVEHRVMRKKIVDVERL